MKNFVLALGFIVLSTETFAADAGFKSVYTDVKADCVTISQSNDNSEIDFLEATCKSFGGYELLISGGDVRYAPQLKFSGQPLTIDEPGAFHDIASDKIEWIYQLAQNREGFGQLDWKGLIYRLSVSDREDGSSRSVLYAVRLDGAKTCTIGTAKTNDEARALVYNSKPGCK
jgi:hypothetical protein